MSSDSFNIGVIGSVSGGVCHHDETANTAAQSGGVYDPVRDAWSTLSATNAPGGVRTLQSAPLSVWTGDRFMIFGGEYGDGSATKARNTGGIYVPVTPPNPP